MAAQFSGIMTPDPSREAVRAVGESGVHAAAALNASHTATIAACVTAQASTPVMLESLRGAIPDGDLDAMTSVRGCGSTMCRLPHGLLFG